MTDENEGSIPENDGSTQAGQPSASATAPDLSTVGIDDSEISKSLEPFVVEYLSPDDPRWQQRASALARRWRGNLWWRRVTGWRFAGKRTPEKVRSIYEPKITASDWPDPYVIRPSQKESLAEWRNQGLVFGKKGAIARIHLTLIARVIEVLRPRTVLEVGCGDGINLFSLASRFPEIKFAGGELTESGVARAQSVQQADGLPRGLTNYCPWPVVDPTAFRRIDFRQADARNLPFKDNAFDLVITRQALEQMDLIRDAALSEIARVAGKNTIMAEPFADFNRDPLRRNYVRAKQYFTLNIEELKTFGIEPITVFSDLPQALRMGIGVVVGRVG